MSTKNQNSGNDSDVGIWTYDDGATDNGYHEETVSNGATSSDGHEIDDSEDATSSDGSYLSSS